MCSCSGVETNTAVTSGCSIDLVVAAGVEIGARLLGQCLGARSGSRSEIARKRTDGCLAASRARSVPMRPAPTTAIADVVGLLHWGSCWPFGFAIRDLEVDLVHQLAVQVELIADEASELLPAGCCAGSIPCARSPVTTSGAPALLPPHRSAC